MSAGRWSRRRCGLSSPPLLAATWRQPVGVGGPLSVHTYDKLLGKLAADGQAHFGPADEARFNDYVWEPAPGPGPGCGSGGEAPAPQP